MEAFTEGAEGSIANEREKLAIMATYGAAIMIYPAIRDDGTIAGNAIYCAMCGDNGDASDADPVPFMVCDCLEWNCIKDAVWKHLEFHADKLIVVREN